MSGQNFLDGRVTLLAGDCLEILAALPESSVDSVVCDPPYGLQFMGREWDKLWRNGTEADVSYVERTKGELTSRARKLPDYSASKPEQMQEFHEAWARLVLRVLRPGGHLVAFSGTRTYHRMACAIEDAGFEIRDQIGWAYGSGFPKSHDVSKGIDRAAGAEREKIVTGKAVKRMIPGADQNSDGSWIKDNGRVYEPSIEIPATEEARQWQGWGTALKPAWEPICLARKPLIGTVAQNCLTHGVGALNIDGCRIEAPDAKEHFSEIAGSRYVGTTYNGGKSSEAEPRLTSATSAGRWPANICHDGSEEVVGAFPDVHGAGAACGDKWPRAENVNVYGKANDGMTGARFGDSGSAARFFYTAKADAEDRLGSKHPTVKPLDLMQWLVRLVTPKGGTVLDPFSGTGTTGEAAWREGMRAILIEREPEYQADIARRMDLATKPTKRAAVAKTKNNLDNPSDLPLFAEG
jgi:DNA modification methylase